MLAQEKIIYNEHSSTNSQLASLETRGQIFATVIFRAVSGRKNVRANTKAVTIKTKKSKARRTKYFAQSIQVVFFGHISAPGGFLA